MSEEAPPPSTEVEYKIALPAGVTMDVTHVVEDAKLLGLTQEQAQKLADRRISLVQAHEKTRTENEQKQLEDWQTELKNDKVLGGDNFAKTLELADKGIQAAEKRNPGITDRLKQTGLIKDPKFVRLFHEIGSLNKDDVRHDGTRDAPKLSMNERLVNSYAIKKG